ncbi:multidrug efflux protein, AcrB/AcrD/AcrF family [Aurantimonas manganoxydans SI85-9A1]|uniref:Multidrug efflux protein, AcrB/AcrD/AcrF family n=1 Tax=Aurantimonas manganoxydans (strain ATCC BAA-1229 / DSM 21871 / SI85-9A1) TaxID=287752 RepID=Q1YLR0_AURMS|nr:efflux RND transporter permease subunit [Aurantimonas manganoxydans]EAS51671.1 multidrug efflux protein, AcrB/AcrD/AcrF family [Aurantimonas manganoxydans SI85-9A1]
MSTPAKPDGITAFTSLFIRRPVLTIVVNLLIVVAGLAAFGAIEVRELPNVDRPVISVSIDFPGASPETVDRQITSEIESAVARVSGIASVSSKSEFGDSRVTIEFTDATDLNVAASDVRNAVSRIANSLPEGAEEPRIVKADADASAIMRLAVTAPGLSIEDLTTLVEDRIADQLAAVEGVADLQIYGEREKVIYVDVDPDKLATRGLTLGTVSTALQNAALDVPAGSLGSPSQDLIVRADANVTSPEEFETIFLDDRTRLGDVASVRFGPDDAASQLRRNGETGVGMGVVRQAGSSTLDISDGIRAEVANLNETLPDGVTVRVTSDDATFINGAIHEVEIALGISVAVVIFVIFLFLLNVRATIIPAVTMPIALIGVVAFIYLVGFSINILTLLALVLATGMVVDDAIIVLENIVRQRDMGARPQAAAVLGTREVFFAVISTTATLAAVFVPISFLPGQAGGLFREFGFVLAMAVVISSFIALTLCPMLAAYFLKAREAERRPGPFQRSVRWFGARLAGMYAVSLRFCLAFPLLIVVGAGIFSFAAYLTFLQMPQELTPTEDRGVVLMSISAPQGASLEYTNAQLRRVEDVVIPYVENGEADNVFAISGRGSANSAFLVVSLKDWAVRARSQQEIVAEINGKLRRITGVRAFAIQPNSLGIRGGGRGLQFAIAGQNFEELAESADELLAAMQADGRWGDVRLSEDATQPQLSVVIDRARASDLGIDIDGLATAMQALLDGREIGQTYVEDKQIPIRLIASSDPVNDPDDMRNIFLKASDGRIVPMSTVASVEEKPIAPALTRENRSRAVSLSAQIPDNYSIQEGWTDLQVFAEEILPADQRLVPLAEAATLNETNSGLALVFGFAIVIIILVLAAQFESFVSAFIIIATVPLGVACAIFALDFFGMSLNLYSQIGLVLLVGIMAKNGILIVEFANQLREEGLSVREAVEQAALIRLRPVMMTMIATVVGGVPLVLASGAGAEARVALGYVIVGGLGLATFSTLYVTPVAYLILGRFSTPNAEKSARLQRDIAEAEAAQRERGRDRDAGTVAPAE